MRLYQLSLQLKYHHVHKEQGFFYNYLIIQLKNLKVFLLQEKTFYVLVKKYLSLHQHPFKIQLKLIYLNCNHNVVLYVLI